MDDPTGIIRDNPIVISDEGETAADPIVISDEGETVADPIVISDEGETVADPIVILDEGESADDPIEIMDEEESADEMSGEAEGGREQNCPICWEPMDYGYPFSRRRAEFFQCAHSVFNHCFLRMQNQCPYRCNVAVN